MRHGNTIAISIMLVLRLAGLGLAEDPGVERRVDAVQQAKTAASLVEYLGRHIDLLGESVARRCLLYTSPSPRDRS